MAPKHWTAPGVLRGVNRQLASKSSPRIRPPAVVPHGGEISCMDIYISPMLKVGKHPHYSECSVCSPIYIHAPPTI